MTTSRTTISDGARDTSGTTSRGTSSSTSRSTSTAVLDVRVDATLHRRPAVGLAVGVVRGGRLEAFYGHGVADVVTRRPITEDTGFRIASISKTITAVAVMQLWERGVVKLDAPANDYLTAYRLVPARAGDRPATVRHLLTHTAGLPEVVHATGVTRPNFGESWEAGRPMPSLAEFYRGGLRLVAEPGRRFVYTNHGPATLGQIVEDVSGMPLERYLRDHVFAPLGMTETDLRRTARVSARLATGYEIRSRGVAEITEREMVTAGAAQVFSTTRDMARYLAALMSGGEGESGRILRPETVARMVAPQFQPDPRIPGMGLGFWRHDLKGRLVVGHQGTHPGFHSQLSFAPRDGVGVMAFTNGARQADFWLPALATRLLRDEMGVDDRLGDIPHRPDRWGDLCGWYQLDAAATDVRLRGMLGLGAEVVARHGRLEVRFLTPVPALAAGMPLVPDDPGDPDVFRVELPGGDLEPIRIVFGRDAVGRTDRLHLDVMPLTLEKRPASSNPRRWAGRVAGVAAGAAAGAAVRRVLRGQE